MKQLPYASKIGNGSTQRSIAQSPQPAIDGGQVEHRSLIFTYFTKADATTEILYNGDRMWAKVTLTLETAGPVAVGQSSALVPVLTGTGQLLETGVPTVFDVAKGNIIYIASTSINRVKVVLSPYPWMETIVGRIGAVVASLSGTVTAAMEAVRSRTSKL